MVLWGSRAIPRSASRTKWVPITVAVLLAAVVRIVVARQTRVVWGDEPFYLWLGQSLWAGDDYHIFGLPGSHFPPLFPALAGGLALLVGDLWRASELLYIVSGALLVVPLAAIANRLGGRWAAFATALAAATYPALVTGVRYWGTMTEPVYLLLVATALYVVIAGAEERGWGAWALTGALLGLAYLTRTEALILVIALLGMLALLRVSGGQHWQTAVLGVLLGALVFLLVALPHVFYLHGRTGTWSLTGAAGMAYVSMEGLSSGNLQAFDESTWGLDDASGEVYLFAPSSEGEGLAGAILRSPGQFLDRLRANLVDLGNLLFSARLVPIYVSCLSLLGLFARPWTKTELRGQLVLLTSLAAPLSYVPFFVQDRYMAGILLPVLVWTGLGVAVLGAWSSGTWAGLRGCEVMNAGEPRFLPGIVAVLLALVLLWQGPRLQGRLETTNSFQPGHLAAAQFLRGLEAGGHAVVMSRYPAVAFHAGVTWAPTPAAEWEDVYRYARAKGAKYLVIDRHEGRLRPQLAFLLDPAQAPPELEYVTTLDEGRGKVVVYRVN